MSGASLLEYASKPYDKGAHGAEHQVLGAMGSVKVVVDFVCSDLCPAYTVRVIHFDVKPGGNCTEVGGVTKTILVPVSIAAMQRPYCFPKILTDNWNRYVR